MTDVKREAALEAAIAQFAAASAGTARGADAENNLRDLDRLARVWELSGGLADSPSILALRRQALRGRARPVRAGWRRRFAFAGSCTAAAAAAASAWLLLPAVLPTLDAVQNPLPMQVVTGPGAQRIVEFPDGSQVRLDGRSSITVSYDDTARRVRLNNGRAYFDVRHDPHRPFLVSAGSGETLDVGTRFTVDRNGDQVTVALIDGEIAVRGAESRTPLALKPGEVAAYKGHSGPKRLDEPGSDPLDWTRGVVTLNDMPLDRAVLLLSRYSPHPIEIGKSLSTTRTVTGVFRINNSAGFAQTLANALSLKLLQQPDGKQVLEAG